MQAFISFSYKDKIIAEDIARTVGTIAEKVWWSEWSMRPGDSLVDKISEGISSSSIVLAVISSNSIKSHWVRKEITIAQTLAISGKISKLIPILIGNFDVTEELSFLSDIVYLDYSDGGDFRRKLRSAFGVKYSRSGIAAISKKEMSVIKVPDFTVWDLHGILGGEWPLLWKFDYWNNAVDLFVSDEDHCALHIPLSKSEWTIVSEFYRPDIWDVRPILEGSLPSISGGSEFDYTHVVRIQGHNDDGVSGRLYFKLSNRLYNIIESIRVEVLGE